MDRNLAALHNRLRTLVKEPFVVLDTETTGLVAPELVSVAVLDSHGRTILDEVVRPAKPIDPDAGRISGLTDAVVADRPEFPEIEAALSAALRGRVVVIYNAAFDTKVLANTYARYGFGLPEFTAWCAMEWFAELNGDWDTIRQAFRWQSLAAAAAHFGISQAQAHNALDDCRTTLRVVQSAAVALSASDTQLQLFD